MTTALSTLHDRLRKLIGDDNSALAHRYTNAINNASRELYSDLFKPLVDETLITGNILPPFIWTSSSALALYTTSNITLTKTTTGGLFRNGTSSAKALAGAADGYITLTSDSYPRLLDLMDLTVDYKCWAYPYDTDDDSFLTIYTVQADGTAQTLNSTTASYSGKFNLLELEDQELNDDLADIEFRMRVHTDAKYTYFDPPRVIGASVVDYMLPQDFQDGVVSQVWLQTSGYSDDACDDLHPKYSEEFGWTTFTGTDGYKYLHFPYAPTSERKIKLVGYCPLEDDLDEDTDTISLDNPRHINILLNYAAHLVYEMEAGVVSGQSVDRYTFESNKWLNKAMYLINQGGAMTKPAGQISWTI